MQVVYFIKHMTAYEMRISDWSSDVCTSDLSSLKCCSTSIGNACIQFGCAVWPIGLVPGRLGCSCMPNKSSRETTIKGLGALATKPRMASRGTSVGGLAGAPDKQPAACMAFHKAFLSQIGRASCRERVCQYV